MDVSRETLARRGITVTAEAAGRLSEFLDLLVKWNARLNLVSARHSSPVLLLDHLVDSLQLARWIPEKADVAVDLGSGAGFPGLVLAIMQGIPFHLIEADGRKCSFLTEAARRCSASAMIHATRIERCRVAAAPIVTARGLAPLEKLLPFVKRFLTDDGTALLPKGRHHTAELAAAERAWSMSVTTHKSITDERGVILVVSNLQPRQLN